MWLWMRQVGLILSPYFIYLMFLSVVGNVYIADSSSSRILQVAISTGILITVAGTGINSYSGDGGQATSATLYIPYGVALDPLG